MYPEVTLVEPIRTSDLSVPYFLWIDGVGGFLLCFSHRLTLGQANPDSPVDIALLADVSRHHATIQRDGDGYFLEAIRKVQINGQPVTKVFLRSGDRFTLGTSCQMQFWQPVPLSTSARLDLVSGHRFLHPVQSVVLMSDSVVIGPGPQAHVVAPDLHQQMVVFRNKNGLGIRWAGNILVNGTSHQDKVLVKSGDTVSTDRITLALESVRRT